MTDSFSMYRSPRGQVAVMSIYDANLQRWPVNYERLTVERRRDLDLLRVLLVFGLVFFHTARIFDTLPLPEGVKNEPPSATATIFVAFFALWGMPLMFAISGFAVWHSLRRRTASAFLRERVQRLLVPFVFGVLAIVPPQVYFHLKQVDPAANTTYWQFLPQFFDVRLCHDLVNAFICPNPATGLFTTTHLWFLKDLFLFSVLFLPLFLYLRGQRGGLLVGRLASFLARPGAILLLGLPVAVVEAGLVTSTIGGSWNEYTIEVYKVDPLHSYDWGSLLWRGVKSVGAWAWIVAILGFWSRPRPDRDPKGFLKPSGSGEVPRRPSLGARVMAYAGEAFLVFYILHQTVIFVIGYYVVQWEMAALLKHLVISLSSLAATLLLYELAVRRTRVTRWLFGMRPKWESTS